MSVETDVAEHLWISSWDCVITTKQKGCEAISRIPEESTFEDIQYHLYVLQYIEQGEQDIEDGKILTHDQVERRLAKWLR